MAAAVAFAALFAWRSSPTLQTFNALAALGCLGMVGFASASGRARLAGTWEWVANGAMSAVSTAAGAFALVFFDADWAKIASGSRSPRTSAVVRGVLIALPLLLLFGALFASADAFFKDLLGDAIPFGASDVFSHLFLAFVFAWLIGGFLWSALLWPRPTPPAARANAAIPFGKIEVAVVFGLLDALFLAFVAVQFRYLFGGEGRVEASSTLTYAQYARHGFFELVTVAALVAPVVLAGHWLLVGRARRLYAVLAGLLVVLVVVVMVSAVQRMRLYTDAYGLTELRFYTMAFMAWLLLVFAWLSFTVLRGQRDRFPLGAAVTGLAVLVALNVANPDGMIASRNLDARGDRPLDVNYVGQLSDDAVPAILSHLQSLPQSDRCLASLALLRREPGRGDWRSWDLGRFQAERKIEQRIEELRAACR